MTNIFGKEIPANVKCDCGHVAKDHYQGVGFCHHSQHENPGGCGCSWFWPNVKYILTKKKEYEEWKKLNTISKRKKAT
jgi:hypothetical protein